MFHRVFSSHTTHLFHRDSLSPDHFHIFFLFSYILTVHPLMFHRVFPSYTTHLFRRDSLSLHVFFLFPYILIDYFNSTY